MRMHNPPHPGEVIREYLGDITVSAAAEHLGVGRVPCHACSTAKLRSRRRWLCAWLAHSAPLRLKYGCAFKRYTTFGRFNSATIFASIVLLTHSNLELILAEDKQLRFDACAQFAGIS